MSGDISGYYIVIKCLSRERESRFARLKDFLLSALRNLILRIRKRFSQIIFNGRPICVDPKDKLPHGLRRISHRKLKQIKEFLETFDAGTKNIRFFRQGNLAPPPSARSPNDDDNDLEIEIIPVDNQTKAADDEISVKARAKEKHKQAVAEVEVPTKTGEDEAKVVKKKLQRPKAAKGRRADIVIPPFVLIDEELVAAETSCMKKRQKAAKGGRIVVVEHPIDLPTEELLDRYQSPDRKERAYARQRPAAPRPRARKQREVRSESEVKAKANVEIETEGDLDAQVDELLMDLRTITTPCKAYKVEPKEARPAEAAKPVDVTKRAHKARTSDVEEDEDIFNVPYLPKSQRIHASCEYLIRFA